MATANTKECFRACVGQRVIGVMFDKGAGSLVLEDGRSLVINNNGAYWIDSQEDTDRRRDEWRSRLEQLHADFTDLLTQSGVQP